MISFNEYNLSFFSFVISVVLKISFLLFLSILLNVMSTSVWLAIALGYMRDLCDVWSGIGDNFFSLIVNIMEERFKRINSRDKITGTLIETVFRAFKVLKAIPIINENSFLMMAKSIPTNLNIYAQSSL